MWLKKIDSLEYLFKTELFKITRINDGFLALLLTLMLH